MTYLPNADHLLSRRHTAVDQVHAIMLAAIVGGELAAGHEVRDQVWATELDLSRTPIREAIKRLENHGLVDIAAARYTRIVSFTPEQALQEAKDWAAIHVALVSAACGTADRALLSSLEAARRRCRTSAESRHDATSFAFFERLREATQSFSIRLSATAVAYRFRLAHQNLPDRREADLALHADIVTALRRNNADLIAPAFGRWMQAVSHA